jgi:peptidoglycan/LPS O-acetylase OafA/YrhL
MPSKVFLPSPYLSTPATITPRLGYLDGLWAVAALSVVLSHSWSEVWTPGSPATPGWTWLFTQGHIAVDLFIVLSGFSLMLPVVRGDGRLRGGAWGFFKKRARRIVPPYYFAMAFSLLLIFTLVGHPTGTHWDISLPVTWHSVLIHILLLQNFFPHVIYKN